MRVIHNNDRPSIRCPICSQVVLILLCKCIEIVVIM